MRSKALILRRFAWNCSTNSTATTSCTIGLCTRDVAPCNNFSEGTIRVEAIAKDFIAAALAKGLPIEIDQSREYDEGHRTRDKMLDHVRVFIASRTTAISSMIR